MLFSKGSAKKVNFPRQIGMVYVWKYRLVELNGKYSRFKGVVY